MCFPRSRTSLLAILFAALLLRAAAQQPAASDSTAPASSFAEPGAGPAPNLVPSGSGAAAPNLFPTTPAGTNVPDFSGNKPGPASSFGGEQAPSSGTAPDFSRSFSGPSSGGAGTSGSAAAAGRGAAGTATPGYTGPAPASGGFVPGPFSSPATTTPTTPNGVAAPASVFGTTTLGAGTGLGAGSGTGTAGLGGANTRAPQPSTPSSFSLPGGYGQAPLTFSAGQGRLARPRYVFTGTFQFGYDDNILQTPTAQLGIPAVYQTVQTQAEIPDQTFTVLVPPRGPQPLGIRPPPVYETRVIKGQPAVFERQLVSPAVEPQEKIGSIVARSGIGFEMQLSNSRTVFTADAHVNADYYFDRPNDQLDLNGNVALVYAHRFSPRTQFSANVSAAYLSQPDLRVVSGPTRNVGDFFTYNSKFDLSYQWAKHFSTVTSVTLGALEYMNEVQQLNDTYSYGLGTELRYTYNPKLTLVAEVRYGHTTYPNGPNRDSSSYYLLGGADFAYSRRLTGTIRLGESVRSFDSGGDATSAPYLETTTSYRYSSRGTLNWTNRFGFEEPQDASSEVLVFRSNLSFVQAFTARLRGSVSLGYIHRTTSSTQSANNTDITGDTYQVDLGLDYALTRKFSVNASYSFVDDLSSLQQSGYYRNQIFLGAQYTY